MRISDWSADVCSSDLEQFLLIQLGAILFMAVGIVIAGYWSDVSSAQRVLTWGCGATILMGFLFGPSLASESWPLIFLGLAAALFVMRSEEHTSELQSLMRISYAVFCLKKKNNKLT